jgi:uncharacterized linocin/CFP29 family protein
MNNNNGREKLNWPEELWDRIDQAVHHETTRTEVASKFLPLYGPVGPALTVPSDTVETNGSSLGVDESATTSIVELLVEFALTPQQVDREMELKTATTLATRATNLLSRGKDVVLQQGAQGVATDPMFAGDSPKVHLQSGQAGTGLLNVDLSNEGQQTIEVEATAPGEWGENTFRAVSDAYSRLQSGRDLPQAHYGPYACVLDFRAYADSYAPLRTTLIMPADRIKPLMTQGFYGTGTVPNLTGYVVSLGGNTMDLVVGMDATTAFMQEAPDGRYIFRVYGRWALRFKDPSAIIKLVFEPQPDEEPQPDATDAALRRAEELGVDLATVEGTGNNGRVTLGDVERAAN